MGMFDPVPRKRRYSAFRKHGKVDDHNFIMQYSWGEERSFLGVVGTKAIFLRHQIQRDPNTHQSQILTIPLEQLRVAKELEIITVKQAVTFLNPPPGSWEGRNFMVELQAEPILYIPEIPLRSYVVKEDRTVFHGKAIDYQIFHGGGFSCGQAKTEVPPWPDTEKTWIKLPCGSVVHGPSKSLCKRYEGPLLNMSITGAVYDKEQVIMVGTITDIPCSLIINEKGFAITVGK